MIVEVVVVMVAGVGDDDGGAFDKASILMQHVSRLLERERGKETKTEREGKE